MSEVERSTRTRSQKKEGLSHPHLPTISFDSGHNFVIDAPDVGLGVP